MATTKLTLTSYNMGDVSEQDFEFWTDFVRENVNRLCGFAVEVDAYRFGESAARDYVGNAANEQEDAIREALRSMWDDFCGGGWDAAYKAVGANG